MSSADVIMGSEALSQVFEGMSKHQLEDVRKSVHIVLKQRYPSSTVLKKTRRPRNLSKVIPRHHLDLILSACHRDHWHRVLLLQLVFGLRASEIKHLEYRDGLLHIYAPKTNKLDVIPVPESAEWLVQGCESLGYHPSAIGRMFRHARRLSGLERTWGLRRGDGARLQQYYGHCLRHTGIDYFRQAVDGNPWKVSSFSRHDLPSRFGALGFYAHSYDLEEFRDQMELAFGDVLRSQKRMRRLSEYEKS